MPVITRELLRKRAEHNEGMITTLEEISLHQEELESINAVLGMTCRKLKILYLQNNIISRMENLFHLKDLVYLNLALNNITAIEGLHNCEFLSKLDLTVNFVDFDTLKDSIEHLQSRSNLKELFMMGNPSEHLWKEDFSLYVVAKLPQLHSLDGTEVTRSLQIKAAQKLPLLEQELAVLAAKVLREKQEKLVKRSHSVVAEVVESEGDDKGEELTDNTPETRVKIYQELAQQKKEKEDRERQNAPKQRDYEKEHADSLRATREKEEAAGESEIKQKNEGGWEFFWDEESRPGAVVLEVRVARHLDSSLIDVDVHPSYVSMVIKGKVLRLRLPAEVQVSESKCQRSKVNGSLLIVMPKVNQREYAVTISGGDAKARKSDTRNKPQPAVSSSSSRSSSSSKEDPAVRQRPKRVSLQEQLLRDAQQQQLPGPSEQLRSRPTNDCSLLEVGDNQSGRNDATDGMVPIQTIVEEKNSGGVGGDGGGVGGVFGFSSLVVELD